MGVRKFAPGNPELVPLAGFAGGALMGGNSLEQRLGVGVTGMIVGPAAADTIDAYAQRFLGGEGLYAKDTSTILR